MAAAVALPLVGAVLAPLVLAQIHSQDTPSWPSHEPGSRSSSPPRSAGTNMPGNPAGTPEAPLGGHALLAAVALAFGAWRLRRRPSRRPPGSRTTDLLGIVAGLLLAPAAFGQTILVEYSFLGEPGNQASAAAATVHSSVTASAFTRGSGLQPQAQVNSINSSNWSTSATAPASDDYYGFTVTPAEGSALNLTRLTFRHARSSTPDGARNWSLRTSLDGFTSDVATGSTPANVATQTVALTAPAFQGLDEPISLRIYGWNAQNSGVNARYRIAEFARLEGVRVEAGVTGWRMLSPPVAGATVGILADLSLVQGLPDEYPGFDPNVYTGYNGNNQDFSGTKNRGFTRPDGLSSPLASGRGFIWFLWEEAWVPDAPGGSSASEGLPLVLAIPETGPSADVTATFTQGDRHPTVDDGFFLIGNPFDDWFDVAGVSLSPGSGQLSTSFQRWNPNTGSYTLFSALAHDFANSWYGFFAEVTDPVFDLTFEFDFDCVVGCPGRSSIEWHRVALVLDGTVGGADARDEAAMVVYSSDADLGWDRHDASKVYPMGNMWAILSPMGERGGELVARAVESRPLPDGLDEVPVAFSALGPGEFTVRLGDQTNAPVDWVIELEDTVSGQVVDLRSGNMQFAVQDVTWMQERFLLRVSGTTVSEEVAASPGTFGIETAYPNPSAGRATVVFHLAVDGEARLEVYDVLGRRVMVLADGERAAGRHTVAVDAPALASGVYVVRLVAGGEADARRLTIVR